MASSKLGWATEWKEKKVRGGAAGEWAELTRQRELWVPSSTQKPDGVTKLINTWEVETGAVQGHPCLYI